MRSSSLSDNVIVLSMSVLLVVLTDVAWATTTFDVPGPRVLFKAFLAPLATLPTLDSSAQSGTEKTVKVEFGFTTLTAFGVERTMTRRELDTPLLHLRW